MNTSDSASRSNAYWLASLFVAVSMIAAVLAVPAPASPQESTKVEEPQSHAEAVETPTLVEPFAGATPRASGGPDVFGYEFVDSAEAGGPVFTAADISTTGALVATGDDVTGPVVLGAPFRFYGTVYTTLHPTTNGMISTASDSAPDFSNDCTLPATPSTGTGARIYPLHDDYFSDVYYQYFATSPVANPNGLSMGASVFQWDAEHWGTEDGIRDFTFWAVLFDNDDMVYQVGAGNTETGSGSTTGIQNTSATDALTVACNTSDSVPDNYAVWVTTNPTNCTLTDGISNGSFETGDFSGWCIDSGAPGAPHSVVATGSPNSFGFPTAAPTDGGFLARHGNYINSGPSLVTLRQQVSIPTGVAVADLTFDYRGAWDFTVGAPPPTMDVKFDVVVEPPGGGTPLATTNLLTSDFAVSQTVLDAGQASASVDLLAYAGSSVVVNLQLTIPEPAVGPVQMDVDNAKLDIKFPDTVGLVDISQGKWYLTNSSGVVTSFFYGNPGDLPISGDWDGNGTSTPGLYRQSDGFFYARNSNSVGVADDECFAGDPSDIPIVGDWDGDGDDNLGIYRPSEQMFYLFTITCTGSPMGAAQISLGFGNPGDKPVAGDWDGDGIDEIGLHRESTGLFYWRNSLDTGVADGSIIYGDPNDRFVAGDWGVVDVVGTPAIFRPSDLTFYFRHTLTQGNADSSFLFPGSGTGWLPVAGKFGLG